MTKWAACQVGGHIRPPQKSIFQHHLLYSTYKRISHSHILDLSQRKCTWIDFATAKMTIFIYFSKFIKIFLPLVLDLTTTMKRHHSRFIFLNYLWSIERQQKVGWLADHRRHCLSRSLFPSCRLDILSHFWCFQSDTWRKKSFPSQLGLLLAVGKQMFQLFVAHNT